MASCRVGFLFLFCLLSYNTALEPAGIKIRITNPGLNMLKGEVLKFLHDELMTITWPRIELPELELVNLKVTAVHFRYANLHIQNSRFSLKLTEGLMKASCDNFASSIYTATPRPLKRTSAVNVRFEHMAVELVVTLTKDGVGRPTINVVDCEVEYGNIYTEIPTNRWRDLNRLLRIHERICNRVKELSRDHVNAMFEKIPVDAEIYKSIHMDSHLLADPMLTDMGVDMDFKGVFYSLDKKKGNRMQQSISVPGVMVSPVITQSARMFYLAVNSHCFNTELSVAFAADLLQATLTEDKVPEDVCSYLVNNNFMKADWCEKQLSLDVAAVTAPTVTISPTGISVDAFITVTVNVLNREAGDPLQLLCVTTVNARPSIEGTRLSLQLDINSFRARVPDKNLASTDFGGWITRKLQEQVIPHINNQGFQIPIPKWMHLNTVNLEPVYECGYLVIGADLASNSTKPLQGQRGLASNSTKPLQGQRGLGWYWPAWLG